jgi:hypothetical protein
MVLDSFSCDRSNLAQALESDLDFAPESWLVKHGFMRVGGGKQTKSSCGHFGGHRGCNRVELHNLVTLDGVNYSGKVYGKPYFDSCGKPTCPKCYVEWAKREAHKIEVRLMEASKCFGKVEHLVVSPVKSDYGLGIEVLRRKAVKVLSSRGVIGGCLIFHAEKYHKRNETYWGEPAHWFFAPHWHVLGFISGGYGCRACSKVTHRGYVSGSGRDLEAIGSEVECSGCSGFEAVTRRLNRGFVDSDGCEHKGDGYIVKVMGERKTVGGSAFYQLNHSTVRVGSSRAHAVTWFGCCSYRKMKIEVEDKKCVCPICQQPLVKLRYFGSQSFVLDKSSPLFKKEFFADLMEGDRQVWFEDTRGLG